MYFNFEFIMQNLLWIVAIIFFLSIAVYFGFELLSIKNKTKDQKGAMLIKWGLLFAIIALIVLFTSAISLFMNKFQGKAGDSFAINELKKSCANDKPTSKDYILYQDRDLSCKIIKFVSIASYAFLALGAIFLILGISLSIDNKKNIKKK